MQKLQELPNPVWKKYFSISPKGQVILAFSEQELIKKIEEFGLKNNTLVGGKSGSLGDLPIYEILWGKPTLKKKKAYQDIVGPWPQYNFPEIQEKGLDHPIFLPSHGCFGFIGGHLILANRHHMEIMYRLTTEAGWTWDQLVNAEQVWGWYHVGGQIGTCRFSSDAGSMSGQATKDACQKAFEDWFGKPFKKDNGYGGKSKDNYGGNIDMKYGKPGEWGSNSYTNMANSIITSLPDPPTS